MDVGCTADRDKGWDRNEGKAREVCWGEKCGKDWDWYDSSELRCSFHGSGKAIIVEWDCVNGPVACAASPSSNEYSSSPSSSPPTSTTGGLVRAAAAAAAASSTEPSKKLASQTAPRRRWWRDMVERVIGSSNELARERERQRERSNE